MPTADDSWGFGDSQECAHALGRMLSHWKPEYLKQMIDQEQHRREQPSRIPSAEEEWLGEVHRDYANSAITELCEAIAHTVEYVGTETLHPGEGWSWYDALAKYRPQYLRQIVAHHERVVEPARVAKAERDRYPLGTVTMNFQRFGITGWTMVNEVNTMTVELIQ